MISIIRGGLTNEPITSARVDKGWGWDGMGWKGMGTRGGIGRGKGGGKLK